MYHKTGELLLYVITEQHSPPQTKSKFHTDKKRKKLKFGNF